MSAELEISGWKRKLYRSMQSTININERRVKKRKLEKRLERKERKRAKTGLGNNRARILVPSSCRIYTLDIVDGVLGSMIVVCQTLTGHHQRSMLDASQVAIWLLLALKLAVFYHPNSQTWSLKYSAAIALE